jgi:serine/threonine protein kinase
VTQKNTNFYQYRNKYVALKFLAANQPHELHLYQHLQSSTESNPECAVKPCDEGQKYVISLRDSFQVQTEEGKGHTVLVTNVLIPYSRLNKKQIGLLDKKVLLFQLVQGLCFLHKNGVTHGGMEIPLKANSLTIG